MSDPAKPAVLIVGATSPIARALASSFARDGHALALLGRDEAELAREAADLAIRHGVPVRAYPFEATAFEAHAPLLERALAEAGAWAGAVVCAGWMTEQAIAQADLAAARRTIDVNLTGCVSVLEPLAEKLEARGHGFLAVLSSVAGDRGRQSNYLYGAAKAGLTAYCSGLRARLFKAGCHVLTVKPGFVDTAMTYGKPGTFLVAEPARVAASIRRAIAKRRNTLYTPGFWWPIMTMIRAIPEPLFKRLKL